MNRRIVLLGAGGHAKVVLDVLRVSGGWQVDGVVAPGLDMGGTWRGLPIVANDDGWLDRISPCECAFAIGVGWVPGGTPARHALFGRLRARGCSVPPLVHPSAVVASTALLGEGAQVMAGAVVQPDAIIGDNAIVNTGARVDHDCTVGVGAHVAPGSVLCGGVQVGPRAFVGAGAVVLPGVKLGEAAVVSAGARVRYDVPPGGRWVGDNLISEGQGA